VVGAFGLSLFIRDFAVSTSCLRCDHTVTYFCFSPFKCLLPGHFADCLGCAAGGSLGLVACLVLRVYMSLTCIPRQ
jgi:hypothetical protein